MAKIVGLRARSIVTAAGECACEYDTALGMGWTCDACLAVTEGADTVDLAHLDAIPA